MAASPLVPHDNTIIGNTVLYGATAGQLYAAGQAGERLAVRNSGATAVVEGCGSNGCEYMTGGVVVLLGSVGSNFGAGMTGGMAFIYDQDGSFDSKVNAVTLGVYAIESDFWAARLKGLIEAHRYHTASPLATRLLSDWERNLPKFRHAVPHEIIGHLDHPLNVGGGAGGQDAATA